MPISKFHELYQDYEQYSTQKESYTLDELYSLIKDKDSLVELYDCGIRDQSKDLQGLLK